MKEYYKAMKFLSSLFISCLLAVLVGMWLDKKLHCTPVFLLVFLAYALIANFYLLLKGMKEDE